MTGSGLVRPDTGRSPPPRHRARRPRSAWSFRRPAARGTGDEAVRALLPWSAHHARGDRLDAAVDSFVPTTFSAGATALPTLDAAALAAGAIAAPIQANAAPIAAPMATSVASPPPDQFSGGVVIAWLTALPAPARAIQPTDPDAAPASAVAVGRGQAAGPDR